MGDTDHNHETKGIECVDCHRLKLQLTEKDILITACKQDLSEIKRQMAAYAMIRSNEAQEQCELKGKIIAKLEKELLDSRIELMRLQEQLNESKDLKIYVRPAVKAKELEGRLSLIRRNM